MIKSYTTKIEQLKLDWVIATGKEQRRIGIEWLKTELLLDQYIKWLKNPDSDYFIG